MTKLKELVWECLYDHGNGKYLGDASKAQRDAVIAGVDALIAEVKRLKAQAERVEPVDEVWIVVKEHVWEHGDGAMPTLAYLLPSEFGITTYPTFEAASSFIRQGNWPLGWVAMKLKATPPAMSEPAGVCKGAWVLGTACGECSKCIATKPAAAVSEPQDGQLLKQFLDGAKQAGITHLWAQAERVEPEPEYWQWRRKAERWGIDHIYRHEVYATTDDSEVRKLFATPPAAAVSEPVAYGSKDGYWVEAKYLPLRPDKDAYCIAFYTTPPAVSEPVAEVVACNVYQSPNGKYAATVESTERLSVGAELFIHPPQPAAAVSELLTKDDVRAAGGIVHSDGNIFFTNIEKLNAAIRSK